MLNYDKIIFLTLHLFLFLWWNCFQLSQENLVSSFTKCLIEKVGIKNERACQLVALQLSVQILYCKDWVQMEPPLKNWKTCSARSNTCLSVIVTKTICSFNSILFAFNYLVKLLYTLYFRRYFCFDIHFNIMLGKRQ